MSAPLGVTQSVENTVSTQVAYNTLAAASSTDVLKSSKAAPVAFEGAASLSSAGATAAPEAPATTPTAVAAVSHAEVGYVVPNRILVELSEVSRHPVDIYPDGHCLFRACQHLLREMLITRYPQGLTEDFPFDRESIEALKGSDMFTFRTFLMQKCGAVYEKLGIWDTVLVEHDISNKKDYLRLMSTTAAFGGEAELSVIADVYRCGYHIHSTVDETYNVVYPAPDNSTAFMLHLVHFWNYPNKPPHYCTSLSNEVEDGGISDSSYDSWVLSCFSFPGVVVGSVDGPPGASMHRGTVHEEYPELNLVVNLFEGAEESGGFLTKVAKFMFDMELPLWQRELCTTLAAYSLEHCVETRPHLTSKIKEHWVSLSADRKRAICSMRNISPTLMAVLSEVDGEHCVFACRSAPTGMLQACPRHHNSSGLLGYVDLDQQPVLSPVLREMRALQEHLRIVKKEAFNCRHFSLMPEYASFAGDFKFKGASQMCTEECWGENSQSIKLLNMGTPIDMVVVAVLLCTVGNISCELYETVASGMEQIYDVEEAFFEREFGKAWEVQTSVFMRLTVVKLACVAKLFRAPVHLVLGTLAPDDIVTGWDASFEDKHVTKYKCDSKHPFSYVVFPTLFEETSDEQLSFLVSYPRVLHPIFNAGEWEDGTRHGHNFEGSVRGVEVDTASRKASACIGPSSLVDNVLQGYEHGDETVNPLEKSTIQSFLDDNWRLNRDSPFKLSNGALPIHTTEPLNSGYSVSSSAVQGFEKDMKMDIDTLVHAYSFNRVMDAFPALGQSTSKYRVRLNKALQARGGVSSRSFTLSNKKPAFKCDGKHTHFFLGGLLGGPVQDCDVKVIVICLHAQFEKVKHILMSSLQVARHLGHGVDSTSEEGLFDDTEGSSATFTVSRLVFVLMSSLASAVMMTMNKTAHFEDVFLCIRGVGLKLRVQSQLELGAMRALLEEVYGATDTDVVDARNIDIGLVTQHVDVRNSPVASLRKLSSFHSYISALKRPCNVQLYPVGFLFDYSNATLKFGDGEVRKNGPTLKYTEYLPSVKGINQKVQGGFRDVRSLASALLVCGVTCSEIGTEELQRKVSGLKVRFNQSVVGFAEQILSLKTKASPHRAEITATSNGYGIETDVLLFCASKAEFDVILAEDFFTIFWTSFWRIVNIMTMHAELVTAWRPVSRAKTLCASLMRDVLCYLTSGNRNNCYFSRLLSEDDNKGESQSGCSLSGLTILKNSKQRGYLWLPDTVAMKAEVPFLVRGSTLRSVDFSDVQHALDELQLEKGATPLWVQRKVLFAVILKNSVREDVSSPPTIINLAYVVYNAFLSWVARTMTKQGEAGDQWCAPCQDTFKKGQKRVTLRCTPPFSGFESLPVPDYWSSVIQVGGVVSKVVEAVTRSSSDTDKNEVEAGVLTLILYYVILQEDIPRQRDLHFLGCQRQGPKKATKLVMVDVSCWGTIVHDMRTFVDEASINHTTDIGFFTRFQPVVSAKIQNKRIGATDKLDAWRRRLSDQNKRGGEARAWREPPKAGIHIKDEDFTEASEGCLFAHLISSQLSPQPWFPIKEDDNGGFYIENTALARMHWKHPRSIDEYCLGAFSLLVKKGASQGNVVLRVKLSKYKAYVLKHFNMLTMADLSWMCDFLLDEDTHSMSIALMAALELDVCPTVTSFFRTQRLCCNHGNQKLFNGMEGMIKDLAKWKQTQELGNNGVLSWAKNVVKFYQWEKNTGIHAISLWNFTSEEGYTVARCKISDMHDPIMVDGECPSESNCSDTTLLAHVASKVCGLLDDQHEHGTGICDFDERDESINSSQRIGPEFVVAPQGVEVEAAIRCISPVTPECTSVTPGRADCEERMSNGFVSPTLSHHSNGGRSVSAVALPQRSVIEVESMRRFVDEVRGYSTVCALENLRHGEKVYALSDLEVANAELSLRRWRTFSNKLQRETTSKGMMTLRDIQSLGSYARKWVENMLNPQIAIVDYLVPGGVRFNAVSMALNAFLDDRANKMANFPEAYQVTAERFEILLDLYIVKYSKCTGLGIYLNTDFDEGRMRGTHDETYINLYYYGGIDFLAGPSGNNPYAQHHFQVGLSSETDMSWASLAIVQPLCPWMLLNGSNGDNSVDAILGDYLEYTHEFVTFNHEEMLCSPLTLTLPTNTVKRNIKSGNQQVWKYNVGDFVHYTLCAVCQSICCEAFNEKPVRICEECNVHRVHTQCELRDKWVCSCLEGGGESSTVICYSFNGCSPDNVMEGVNSFLLKFQHQVNWAIPTSPGNTSIFGENCVMVPISGVEPLTPFDLMVLSPLFDVAPSTCGLLQYIILRWEPFVPRDVCLSLDVLRDGHIPYCLKRFKDSDKTRFACCFLHQLHFYAVLVDTGTSKVVLYDVERSSKDDEHIRNAKVFLRGVLDKIGIACGTICDGNDLTLPTQKKLNTCGILAVLAVLLFAFEASLVNDVDEATLLEGFAHDVIHGTCSVMKRVRALGSGFKLLGNAGVYHRYLQGGGVMVAVDLLQLDKSSFEELLPLFLCATQFIRVAGNSGGTFSNLTQYIEGVTNIHDHKVTTAADIAASLTQAGKGDLIVCCLGNLHAAFESLYNHLFEEANLVKVGFGFQGRRAFQTSSTRRSFHQTGNESKATTLKGRTTLSSSATSRPAFPFHQLNRGFVTSRAQHIAGNTAQSVNLHPAQGHGTRKAPARGSTRTDSKRRTPTRVGPGLSGGTLGGALPAAATQLGPQPSPPLSLQNVSSTLLSSLSSCGTPAALRVRQTPPPIPVDVRRQSIFENWQIIDEQLRAIWVLRQKRQDAPTRQEGMAGLIMLITSCADVSYTSINCERGCGCAFAIVKDNLRLLKGFGSTSAVNSPSVQLTLPGKVKMKGTRGHGAFCVMSLLCLFGIDEWTMAKEAVWLELMDCPVVSENNALVIEQFRTLINECLDRLNYLGWGWDYVKCGQSRRSMPVRKHVPEVSAASLEPLLHCGLLQGKVHIDVAATTLAFKSFLNRVYRGKMFAPFKITGDFDGNYRVEVNSPLKCFPTNLSTYPHFGDMSLSDEDGDIRERVAAMDQCVRVDRLGQVLSNAYLSSFSVVLHHGNSTVDLSPHVDKAQFGDHIVAVHLSGGPATITFSGGGNPKASLTTTPGVFYSMSMELRWQYEHSVTFTQQTGFRISLILRYVDFSSLWSFIRGSESKVFDARGTEDAHHFPLQTINSKKMGRFKYEACRQWPAGLVTSAQERLLGLHVEPFRNLTQRELDEVRM